MIVQRKGKMTRKAIIELAHNTEDVHNLSYTKFDPNGEIFQIWKGYTFGEPDKVSFWKKVMPKIGKPLNTIPEWESNPGVWIFDDEETGLTFLLYSDRWKMTHYKGESCEVVYEDDKTFLNVLPAYRRFMEHLASL